MNSNAVLKPEHIVAACEEAISSLTSDSVGIGQVKSEFRKFSEDALLQGTAYESLRMQINDYSIVFQLMLSANESDIADYTTLKGLMPSDMQHLIGIDILSGQSTEMQKKVEALNKAQEYIRKAMDAGNCPIIGTALQTYYNNKAHEYIDIATKAEEMYQMYVRQEETYDDIESASAALFENGKNNRRIANDAMTDIAKAFKDGGYTINIGAAWRNEIVNALGDSYYEDLVEQLSGYYSKSELTEDDKAHIDYLMSQLIACGDDKIMDLYDDVISGIVVGDASSVDAGEQYILGLICQYAWGETTGVESQELINHIMDRFVNIALGEVGTFEEFLNGEGTNSVKYNQWFYGNDTRAAWCAAFICYCAYYTGILDERIFKTAGAINLGTLSDKEYDNLMNGDYVPQRGDIFIHRNNDGTGHGHVGIVVGYQEGENGQEDIIYTVEGNSGDGVQQRERHPGYINGGYISNGANINVDTSTEEYANWETSASEATR